jgi:hypothetical protein
MKRQQFCFYSLGLLSLSLNSHGSENVSNPNDSITNNNLISLDSTQIAPHPSPKIPSHQNPNSSMSSGKWPWLPYAWIATAGAFWAWQEAEALKPPPGSRDPIKGQWSSRAGLFGWEAGGARTAALGGSGVAHSGPEGNLLNPSLEADSTGRLRASAHRRIEQDVPRFALGLYQGRTWIWSGDLELAASEHLREMRWGTSLAWAPSQVWPALWGLQFGFAVDMYEARAGYADNTTFEAGSKGWGLRSGLSLKPIHDLRLGLSVQSLQLQHVNPSAQTAYSEVREALWRGGFAYTLQDWTVLGDYEAQGTTSLGAYHYGLEWNPSPWTAFRTGWQEGRGPMEPSWWTAGVALKLKNNASFLEISAAWRVLTNAEPGTENTGIISAVAGI